MWYSVLIALGGLVSGTIATFYYRYKAAEQLAEIVGLQRDVLSLQRDIADRDKALAANVDAMTTLRDDGNGAVTRLNKTLEDTRAELAQHKAALKVLRARDPATIATALGQLFPLVSQADSDSGTTSRGSGHS